MFPLKRWSPMRDLTSLHREMDDLFERMFEGFGRGYPKRWHGETGLHPAIDVSHDKDRLTVRAELPGIDPKDVDISITGNVLTIKGARKSESEVKEEDYYIREISSGTFARRLTLPEGVDTEKIKASYKGGILEVTMPAKLPAEKTRKIEVEGTEKARKLKAA